MRTFAVITSLILFVFNISCGTKANLNTQSVTGTTWELSEMNGQGVNQASYSRGLPYISFDVDNKVSGSSGCNGFSGLYNLNDEGGMNISRVVATKMFCEGIDEKSFFEALTKVNMSKTEKNKLTLMDGTKEVLVFVPKQ